MYFSWMTPLVTLGFKRPLEQADLSKLHPSDDPKKLYSLFLAAWSKELEKSDPSLFMALLKVAHF